MNEAITKPSTRFTCEQSMAARERLLSRRGDPLFIAGWHRVLMMHFEVDAEALQRDVSFQLDLNEGRAYVSLVAFTMFGMRPRLGGKLSASVFRPVATHDFLNVRTYVRHDGEAGIHFLAEWLSSRLAAKFGPVVFGLPYHYGHIAYNHDWENGIIRGEVTDVANGNKLAFQANVPQQPNFQPCAAGSLDDWLMERYTAFNSAGWHKRFFRVWHPPWPQCGAAATMDETKLLTDIWPWFQQAHLICGNYSPGFNEVWMGRPQFS